MANINKDPHISRTEAAVYRAFQSTMAFGKLFLPDFNYRIKPYKNPPAHYEVCQELDSLDNKPVALICTRDFAKSTLCKAFILRRLCFAKRAYEWGFDDKRQEYIGWVSSNQVKSQNHTKYIKVMLERNPKIKEIFGELKGSTWASEKINTAYGDELVSSSNLSSLRGDAMTDEETGVERFSVVLSDDSENENNTITDNARLRFSNTISDAIMPAIETRKPGNKFVFINTPVHYAGYTQDKIDLYNRYPDKKERERITGWKILMYPAILPDGSLVWPDRLTHEFLEGRKKIAAQSKRGISSFYQEYMLQVQNEAEAAFGRKVVKYHDVHYHWDHENEISYIIMPDGTMRIVNTFIGCDPATDINTKGSDFSVIIVFAIDAYSNIYILHYERHRNIPNVGQRDQDDNLIGKMGVVDYIISLYESYHCNAAAVEDVAMTRSVFTAFNARRELLGKWHIILIPVKPTNRLDKHNRIYTVLSQRFSAGKIHIRENTMYELENEIVTFGPRMAHDDTLDALHLGVGKCYPPREKAVKKAKKRKKHVKNNWQYR